MARVRGERRLVAILAADIVGYSRLIEQDEAGTLAAIKDLRREVVDPLLTEHHGRIVKLMGDGTIVEFASVVDAVVCAVAVQRAMAERQARVAPERRFLFRLGVNLGDVVVEGEDLLGDGVNVAARLQQLCEPGGVLVSGTAYDHLQGKLEVPLEFTGEQHLKNIARPIRVWHWHPDGRPHELAETGRSAHRPAIAVLPLANLSGEERWTRLADGISEDIITDLARFPDLMVIARNSTFAYRNRDADVREIGRALGVGYLVEGSFQAADGEIRVTAQLIDATTGAHLWVKRWKRAEARLFEIQDAVVQEVVGALGGWFGEVLRAERRRFARKPPASLEAYELYLFGRDHEEKFTREDTEKAIGLLKRSLARDPSFARAWLVLSYAYNHFEMFQWARDIEANSQARRAAVLEAAELDPGDALVQIELGDMRFRDGDLGGAKACYERALEFGHNTADIAALLAKYVAGILGRPEEALPLLDYAHRLNPHAPPIYWLNELRVCYLTGDYDRAVQAARRSPDTAITLLFLALSLLELGRLAEAQETAVQLSARYPSFKPRDVLRQAWINHPNAIARFSSGVERIGFGPGSARPCLSLASIGHITGG
jgi:TolB-like protein/Tfp pilus assembly protein PilF